MTNRLILTIIRLMSVATWFTATDLSRWLEVPYDLAYQWCERLVQAQQCQRSATSLHTAYLLTNRGLADSRGPLIDTQAEIARLQAAISVHTHERDTLQRANRSFAESVRDRHA
jgi:hypothetical protein